MTGDYFHLRQPGFTKICASYSSSGSWHLIADASADYGGFDAKVMREARILDASIGPPATLLPGQPVAPPSIVSSSTTSLHIDKTYRNQNEVMHGGAYGVVLDMLTTIALGPIARPGYWDYLGGVTRVLNINYLKAIPVGTTVLVHAYVYQVGRTMALIQGWIVSEDGKTVFATCDHHKVRVPTKPEHLKFRVPWDEYWEKTEAKL